MLNWLKLIKKKFQGMNPVIQLIAAIGIILSVRYLVNLVLYSNFATTYLENFGTPKKLVYFHMNGCGYCKEFTPEWEKFVQGYNGNLKLQKIERKEAGDTLLQKYKINGFPTVLLLDENGVHKQYDGERTQAGLEQFVSSQ